MGATLVRIPVHPAAWRERTPREYLKLLNQAVDWCTELNLHIIIDWHSIGNLQMELFQDPMYDTTQPETFEFWRTMAQHFKGTHTIAFYELFNEPTLYRGQLGSMSWSEWKKLNEDMIRLIRAYDTEKIPLVAGLDWAYDLTPLNIEPARSGRHRICDASLCEQAVEALGTEVGGGFWIRRRPLPGHRDRVWFHRAQGNSTEG
jgi:hypothetical protein